MVAAPDTAVVNESSGRRRRGGADGSSCPRRRPASTPVAAMQTPVTRIVTRVNGTDAVSSSTQTTPLPARPSR